MLRKSKHLIVVVTCIRVSGNIDREIQYIVYSMYLLVFKTAHTKH